MGSCGSGSKLLERRSCEAGERGECGRSPPRYDEDMIEILVGCGGAVAERRTQHSSRWHRNQEATVSSVVSRGDRSAIAEWNDARYVVLIRSAYQLATKA